MSRAERLLALMQCLHCHRRPVSGATLAAELGVSVRTLYRDIASLQAQGAHIEGAPGLGYVLRPGYLLPPLMFSAGELEALILGARWVAQHTDAELAADARQALARIGAVLPAELKAGFDEPGLLVPTPQSAPDQAFLPALRQAIRREHKLSLHYRDEQGRVSERVVWPFALGYFERVRVLVAWCELREGMRHFRVDRVQGLDELPGRYPQRRQALLKAWRLEQGIAPSN
ncbi:MAG: Bifunctional ligase/repressor BirA [Pseudomonas citronellolis]|nr:MAG: Bifunctional ligase/repressor BirA [Pseudomonas citronellolis]